MIVSQFHQFKNIEKASELVIKEYKLNQTTEFDCLYESVKVVAQMEQNPKNA